MMTLDDLDRPFKANSSQNEKSRARFITVYDLYVFTTVGATRGFSATAEFLSFLFRSNECTK